MKPSIQNLYKFFTLEAERGYDDHAVLGGLERMLDRWEADARVDGLPEEVIQAVIDRIRNYSRLTPASRAEVLDGLWRRIQRSFDEVIPDLPKGKTDQPEVESKLPEKPAPSEEMSEGESAPAEPSKPKPLPPPQPAPQRRQSSPSPRVTEVGEPAALGASVTVLEGIGPRHAQTLDRLHINTLHDMLYYFPRRFDDYSQLKPINRLDYGDEVTVIGTVQRVSTRQIRSGRMQLVEAIVGDGSGVLRVTWFNQIWIAKRLSEDTQIVLSGKVEQYLGRLVMNNPELELLEQRHLSTKRIVPVYPLTAKITQRWLRQQMDKVVSYWAPRVQDPLPEYLCQSADLVDLPTALLQAHFPNSWDDLGTAHERLAFDEIFLLQLGVLQQKRAWQERTAQAFSVTDEWLQGQIARLPFPLTGAQQRSIQDVRRDLGAGRPMNRLLQGDVGSGKTVVAVLAIAMLVQTGVQAALMAPTSILAEQHYKTLQKMLTGVSDSPEQDGKAPPPLSPEQIRLMIGSTPEAEKDTIRAGLADGTVKLVIGTHALIQDPVTFSNLQLVIVDEQHRFGVEQRATLRSKGNNPHLLVMTATPIPRSLALTVYGDLDLSVIDEMPPGRLPVSTYTLLPLELERAYSLIRSQIEQGRQAFIIYPLVEESEKSEAKAAVEEHAHMVKEVFPGLEVGLLHGRMKPDDKEAVMALFRDGEYQILVSTSVIEVGVDVPNASVMLIEGANRFGLAQLHQFRGRVGRGADKAFCLLVPDSSDEMENERLQAMSETNDGFVLAERDLEQRGPGEFLGTRQAGFSELQFANLTDVHLIEKSRRHAQDLFERDPDLVDPQHKLLQEALERFWSGGQGDIS